MARGLRTAREELGLTMGDAADALSLPVEWVSAWETGRVPMSASELRAYLHALATTKGR